MKCKTIHRKLIFYIDGELSQTEMQKISLHLDKCSGCASFAEELKKTVAIVEWEKRVPDAPYFFSRIKARMQNQQEVGLRNKSFPLWERVLQPALFSFLLLAGIYSGIKLGGLSSTGRPSTGLPDTEIVPYLNELSDEPLEMFLME